MKTRRLWVIANCCETTTYVINRRFKTQIIRRIRIDGNNIEISLTKLTNNKNAVVNFDVLIPRILMDRGLSRLIYFREGLNIFLSGFIPSENIRFRETTIDFSNLSGDLKEEILVQNPVFYYVYGLLKIAVIIQQIYYRHQQGLTQDPRFASLPTAMKQISLIAEQAIKKNKIDNLI